MFPESSNGSGFYPTYSYPCAGCGASIYSSNLEALSHNHVSRCTACLHGSAAFQYEAQAASSSTKCNNELNSANLLPRHHEEVNPVSGFLYAPLSSQADHPLVPNFNIDYRVITQEANNEITKQCEDEINSWLLFNHEDGEEQAKNNGLSYADVDENVDIANYRAGAQIEYQQRYNELQPYSFQPGYNGTESIVSVQSMQAVEQHPEQLHSFYLELEHEAFNADFIQAPSSRWSTASLPSMDACIVPQATTVTYTNLDRKPQEKKFSSNVPPQYCPVTREAKVLRYREKRKARKFEKKIRYSSRKANAETRCRVSGRFARRTEMDLEPDQMPFTTEQGYAFVPSSIRSDGRNITFGP